MGLHPQNIGMTMPHGFAGSYARQPDMVEYATGLGKIMSGSYDAMTKKGFEFSEAQKAIIEGTATEAQIVAELGAEYLDMSADMQAAAAINSVIAESWGGLYETMSDTPEGKIIQLKNRLGDLGETLGDRIYPAVLRVVDVFNDNYPKIEQILTRFSDLCAVIINVIGWLAEAGINAFSALEEHGDLVIAVLIGIGVAALVAESHMVKAALESAIAWAAANLSLLLIAAGVALIIYMAQQMGVTWEQVGSVVGGVLGLMYAFVMNKFIAPAYNAFAYFGNFVGNFLKDPIGSIKLLFIDMATFVLKKVSDVAHGMESLINKIPGMSIDLTSGIDSIYNKVKSAGETIRDEMGWTEYFKSLDYINYADAWNSWSEKGASLGRALDNFSLDDILGDFGSNGFNPSEFMESSGMPGQLDGIGADTSAIRRSVAMSEEDMKLLVDMAERQYVNNINLTAQTPVITINGQNTGDTEADLQWLEDSLRKILVEQAASHTSMSY